MERIVRLQKALLRLRDRATCDGRLRLVQPWILLPGPVALGLALAFPYRWLFFAAYAWLIILIVSYAWVRHLLPAIALQRSLANAWAEVGDQLEETWELRNASRLPLIWLEIDDVSTVPGYTAQRIAAAGPGEIQRWQTAARCTRRGIYGIGPLTLRLSDPLGIFGASWKQGQSRQIVVYPALVRLPNLLPPRGLSGGVARADLLQQMATPSVGGLREYVPGDLPSRIHWPTVARTNQLMVKEFDQERAGSLWIMLDLAAAAYPTPPPTAESSRIEAADLAAYGQSSVLADPHGSAPDTLLELSVILACSLAAQALAAGRSVGLIADDGHQRLVAPGQGPQQLWRILSALVDAQATGTLPVARLAARGPGTATARSPGAGLLLVTPDLGGAWFSALAGWQSGRAGGAQVVLVGNPGSQAIDLIGRMASIGVASQLYRLGEMLAPLHPTRPRPVSRVSPLGRVQRG
jgi:uncharacterized protein (DUF58 family)